MIARYFDKADNHTTVKILTSIGGFADICSLANNVLDETARGFAFIEVPGFTYDLWRRSDNVIESVTF